MEVGLLTAFIGGVLALLSPCGALLLPAFFASTIGTGPRLWIHGGVFYIGLITVLVPLGVGAGAVGTLFVSHRSEIIIGASVLLISLGVIQVLGLGFNPSRLLPRASELPNQAAKRSGYVKTTLLGAASGVAGFCAGPILGAVLTLAAAHGDILIAGTLLSVYGAGMLAPLLLLAAFWGRISPRTRSVLRGRTFTVLKRELHTTSALTGALIICAGIFFWTTNGLVGVPSLLPTSTLAWLQERGSILAHPILDIVAVLSIAAGLLTLWIRNRKMRAQTPSHSLEGSKSASE